MSSDVIKARGTSVLLSDLLDKGAFAFLSVLDEGVLEKLLTSRSLSWIFLEALSDEVHELRTPVLGVCNSRRRVLLDVIHNVCLGTSDVRRLAISHSIAVIPVDHISIAEE